MKTENFETTGTEEEFLEQYEESKKEYPPFALTADVVLLTLKQGQLCVLLIQRNSHPYQWQWALPRGFVEYNESAEEAAVRELEEETGVLLQRGHIEQLKTYSDPNRDPRMRVISTAFIALIPSADIPEIEAKSDAANAHFFPVSDLNLNTDDGLSSEKIQLAFDHKNIIQDGIERTASKLEYTNLASVFLEKPFTIADLRRVYEEVWNTELHAPNFRRKILSVQNFVQPLGSKGASNFDKGNVAQLYERGTAKMLYPPLMRKEMK